MPEPAANNREHWSSRLGFTLAAVGSAVGLGNMWRFSYMTAENGGAAFVFLYIAMTLVVGLPVMLAELTLGRGADRSPVQALVHYGGNTWKPLGALFVAAGFVILAYYGVIAGWTARYAFDAIVTGFPADAGARFGEISEGWDAAAWHVGFMAVTVWVISGGVRSGIERAALLLMPVLGALVIGLAVYAATLEGAAAGYRYYFSTDFAAILDFDVAKDAAGQAFFSLSLGMGAILTYASYLTRDADLPKEAALIAVSDFSVAFLAGLVVFPLLFALGLQNEVVASSLGALFITLPKAFESMGGPGRIVGLLFMIALVVGAVTSAISLLEVVVASTIDTLGWTRRKAALVGGAAITALGVPAALHIGILDLMDQVGGNLMLVAGGLALAIFTGWFMDPRPEAGDGAASSRGLTLWRGLLRYVVPPILAVILVLSLGDSWAKLVALLS
jgi:NSS family neurotransmitter:Na+ symporter